MTIEKLIEMIEEGWNSTPPIKENQIYLICPDRYTPSDIGRLKRFFVFLRLRYAAKPMLVGGGASCSKRIIEMHGGDPDVINKMLRDVLENKLVAEQYAEVNLRTLVWPAHDLKMDPVTGRCYPPFNLPPMKVEYKTEINAPVQNSSVVTGDRNTTILTPQQHVQQLFDQMAAAIKADTTLTPQGKAEADSDLMTLSKELGREKPRQKIVEATLSTLANIATIGGFLKDLAPFIPKLFS